MIKFRLCDNKGVIIFRKFVVKVKMSGLGEFQIYILFKVGEVRFYKFALF